MFRRAKKSNMASNMAAKVENPDLLGMYDFYWIQIIIRQFILNFANAERMFSTRICIFAKIQRQYSALIALFVRLWVNFKDY